MDKIGRLLSYASKGEVESVKMLLDEGLPVDSPDYDGRTAMHLAASEGHCNVIKFLLENHANANPVDRWRKTPLADARWYLNVRTEKKHAYTRVCNLLTNHGGSTSRYGEIKLYHWRGTEVQARIMDRTPRPPNPYRCESELIKQLSILQSCRHPNIVQFLGAVTNFSLGRETKALALITEHLPNGNLRELLHQKKGKIQPKEAVNYALDIARGMTYLHQHRPKPIVHGELNPMNLLRDAAGHLKVSGVGLSNLIGCISVNGSDIAVKKVVYSNDDAGARYIAPEVQDINCRSPPEKSADVYSFGEIVHEMFEGSCLANRQAQVVATSKSGRHAGFLVRTTLPAKLSQLLEECLHPDPKKRPEFKDIILRLEFLKESMMKKWWSLPKPVCEIVVRLMSSDCFVWVKQKPASVSNVDDSVPLRNLGPRAITACEGACKPINGE